MYGRKSSIFIHTYIHIFLITEHHQKKQEQNLPAIFISNLRNLLPSARVQYKNLEGVTGYGRKSIELS